jgi:hypothetical protein
VPFDARPSHNPPGRVGGRAEGCCLPNRTPPANRRECPCGNLLCGLVFENVRQRVGCARLLNLKGVMSDAVEQGRFLLTATRLRNPILLAIASNGKPRVLPCPSGGNTRWA